MVQHGDCQDETCGCEGMHRAMDDGSMLPVFFRPKDSTFHVKVDNGQTMEINFIDPLNKHMNTNFRALFNTVTELQRELDTLKGHVPCPRPRTENRSRRRHQSQN
ncbi:MAG: hypothetical protein ACYCQJ_14875 [Nitrososphaerales archaeon]